MRVNLGCGHFPLRGDWTNIDGDPSTPADLHLTVPPLPFQDGEVDEIYAGHFLEHLTPADALALLRECHRALRPGGKLGVVVPDTREIMRRYLAGQGTAEDLPMGDLDTACRLFLYSTVQDSPHQWSYDMETLARALKVAGFQNLTPINRMTDPRIPVHRWYGCGWDGYKGGQA